MGIIANLVSEKLVDLENNCCDREQFFKRTAQVLQKQGYVHDSFLKGISDREKKYPTGLELENITVAIPHTNVEHVKHPFLYVNKLVEDQIEFIQMGTDNVVVKPEFIFILGIKQPKEQVNLLATLMDLFNQKWFVEQLKKSQTVEDVIQLLSKY